MNWENARRRLLSEANFMEVARATGLHVNGVRRYAQGKTIPRADNAEKIVRYFEQHERRMAGERRSEDQQAAHGSRREQMR